MAAAIIEFGINALRKPSEEMNDNMGKEHRGAANHRQLGARPSQRHFGRSNACAYHRFSNPIAY